MVSKKLGHFSLEISKILARIICILVVSFTDLLPGLHVQPPCITLNHVVVKDGKLLIAL